jgi:hypothetical protein
VLDCGVQCVSLGEDEQTSRWPRPTPAVRSQHHQDRPATVLVSEAGCNGHTASGEYGGLFSGVDLLKIETGGRGCDTDKVGAGRRGQDWAELGPPCVHEALVIRHATTSFQPLLAFFICGTLSLVCPSGFPIEAAPLRACPVSTPSRRPAPEQAWSTADSVRLGCGRATPPISQPHCLRQQTTSCDEFRPTTMTPRLVSSPS